MEPYFDHEKLEVYRIARCFSREIRSLLDKVPRGHSDSSDNLRRAAMSITRNIAEGSGRWKIRDKVHFYHIARASATESAASLDELIDFEVVPPEHIQVPKQVLARVVALLIGMIRSLEARPGPDMRSPRR
ncbi:MAG: four helix bundle protein [Longimicrobiales bacterium]